MAKRVGMVGRGREDESMMTRAVNSVFSFVRFAEFEILFVLFFLVAFIIFKDLYTSYIQGFKRLAMPFLGDAQMETRVEELTLACSRWQLSSGRATGLGKDDGLEEDDVAESDVIERLNRASLDLFGVIQLFLHLFAKTRGYDKSYIQDKMKREAT
ncbi:hypothetical protein RJ640_016711 [Escallonia rubra]|uniref:Uncharacterized protein n=1 Tax=Escallonia rubra TaxID=112253 RepID=A0AA88R2K7_9ASTE|nr:hypothetical protein RJ640_016711 [Escallonia rubra]